MIATRRTLEQPRLAEMVDPSENEVERSQCYVFRFFKKLKLRPDISAMEVIAL